MKIKRFFWRSFVVAMVFGMLCLPALSVVGQEEEIVEEIGAVLEELGLYLDDEGGGFINVRIVEKKIRVYFTDAEKQLVAPTYTTARLKYESVRNKDKEGTMRLQMDGGGLFLVGPRKIFPPYFIWVKLVLLDLKNADNNKYYPKSRLKQ